MTGTTPALVRYYTVVSTTDGSATKPFSQNSYTHIGDNVTGFGGISVYDLTMNTPGAFISRNNSTGGDWTITRNLVVANGTIFFGSAGGTDYGATTAGNVYVQGNGTLDLDYTDEPLVVSGRFQTFDNDDDGGSTFLLEPNVFLSHNAGGDLEVEGELAAWDDSSVTTRTGGGELILTSDPGRLATIAPPLVIGGTRPGGFGVTNDDLVYERYHAEPEGWRFLGSPLEGQTFETLNDDFHTQGATTCADFNFGGDILFTFDTDAPSIVVGETDRFVPVEDYCASMEMGTGYLFYAFDDAPSGELPTRWDVKGQERTSDLALTLPVHGGVTTVVSAFNLVAHPYAGHLDWNEIHADSDSLSATYQVWNPAKNSGVGGYETFTANVDAHPTGAGRYIPPAQGFFVETSSNATVLNPPVLRFSQSQKVDNATPNLFGREGTLPHLRLALAGEGLEATTVKLAFTNEASPGADPYDATLLGSLAVDYVSLGMAAGERTLVVQGVPVPTEPLSVPLLLGTTRAGTYTLTWDNLPLLPAPWTLTLTDLVTGDVVDLRDQPSYSFIADATGARQPRGSALGIPAGRAGSAERFVLEVTPESVPVAVVAEPLGGPVVIGPEGGSFQFAVALTNTTAESQTVGVWTAVEGAAGREPVLGPREVTLPAGATLMQTLTQRVPAGAPAGAYTYHVRLGAFPDGVSAGDSFTFTKEGAARRGDTPDGDWAVEGWEETVAASATQASGEYVLSGVVPNPVRGSARFSLRLAEAQAVTVALYDVLGRQVVRLHDGVLEAEERHAFTLDVSDLAAGVYVLRVEGARFQTARTVSVTR